MDRYESFGHGLLKDAGIEVNGSRPFDIHVHNPELFRRVMGQGSLGFGESYMDGWWDCDQLDEMLSRIFKAQVHEKVEKNFENLKTMALARLTNRQKRENAFTIGEEHYDIGNDLYERMLDKRMVYTCGYWKEADNLDDAQEAKLDLVCKKIGLKKGDKVLDIGCGWGSFVKFAAERYGARCVGVTVSKEQVAKVQNEMGDLPVEIRLQDYREVNEPFDHIISLGMFEHVGYKNYREYMEVAHRCLSDDGFFLLHTIGANKSVTHTDPWIDKYIFPDSMLPSISQISKAAEDLFVMEDWHNFGPYYDKTLMAWHTNFNTHWPEIAEKYGERFKRMWNFYLLSSAAQFRARKIQLWQIVLTKHGVPGGYQSIR